MGFEYTPRRSYMLYITKGIKYFGINSEFRDFLSNGEKKFSEYEDMIYFIKSLKPLYNVEVVREPDKKAGFDREAAPPLRADKKEQFELYDKSKIFDREQKTGVYLDIEGIYSGLTARIKGQDASMRELAEMTSIHLAQVNPRRPATVFMAGPTGTGKTESANALLETVNALAKDQNLRPFHMVRINCNQYKEAHRVAQLLGSPNGYVGYGDPPVVAPIAHNPQAIVLCDEIEKAHSDVLDAIMNAMDTGMIQVPSPINGKHEIDCRQAIFIFTSNLPITGRSCCLGFSDIAEDDKSRDLSEICKKAIVNHGIKPEIAGRILTFLVFNKLTAHVMADIVALAIVDCAAAFGLTIRHIDAKIIQCILDRADTDFGVRTYKQDIQKRLGKAFAVSARKLSGCEVTIDGDIENMKIY